MYIFEILFLIIKKVFLKVIFQLENKLAMKKLKAGLILTEF